jgi:hypothetical protein
MSFWDHVTHAIGNVVHEINDGIHKAEQWVGHLFNGQQVPPSPIAQQVDLILAGNSMAWHSGATKAKDLATRHDDLSTRVRSMAGQLEQAWTGKASDAANLRIQKLQYGLDSAGSTFDSNSSNVTSVASYFDYTQQNVKKLPDPPPEAGFLDRLNPWDTDTETAVNQYNADAKKNVDVYNAYATHTSSSGSSLQGDYGDLGQFDSGEITIIKDPATPPPGTSTTGAVVPETRQGTIDQRGLVPPGTITPPPAAAVPGAHDTGTRHVTPPGGVDSGDDTTTAGFTPAPDTLPVGNVPGTAPGVVPETSKSGTGGVGPYAGVGGLSYLDDAGHGTGTRVPGAGGAPGAGRQSGAGVPGEAGARGSGSLAGRNATGSRLQNGPGGAGPGGRGVNKEEDAEHKRKYVLDEETLFTDEDRMDLDPVTGLPPAPPTIGA